MTTFPHHGYELTTEWLTETLRNAGVISQDCTVASFTYDENTTFGAIVSSCGFVAVTYSGASASSPPLDKFFVKFACANTDFAERFKKALYHEVDYYRRQPEAHKAFTPRVFFVGWEESPVAMCMLMEDLNAQGYSLRCDEYIMPLQYMPIMLRKLAALHAANWNRLDSSPGCWPSVLGSDEGWAGLQSLVEYFDAGWETEGRETMSKMWTPECIEACDIMKGNWRKLFEFASQRPLTFCHGDAHGENWLLSETDGKVCDWQVYRQFNPMADVGTCLASGLETVDRREHERALIRLYHDELVRLGVSDYTYEQAWWDYRFLAGEPLMRFAVFIFSMKITRPRTVRSTVRFAQVAHDHNSLKFFRALLNGTLVRYEEPPE